jgi:ubiquinone/menaquinone biosynthesis C-methylase UbiE
MNCDAIAPYYEVLEHLSFGRRLEQIRFAFLQETRASRRAIVCGGGDGRFLARLLRANPTVQVDFVDLSAKMIELAERRVSGIGPSARGRVRFHSVDIREFAPRAEGYDLIVSHFFLDCFSDAELAGVIGSLAHWAAPDVTWIVSDFRETQGPIGRIWTSGVTRGLYIAFRLTTGLRVTRLPKYVPAIAEAGFRLRHEENALGGLLHSSVWGRPLRAGEAGRQVPGSSGTNLGIIKRKKP